MRHLLPSATLLMATLLVTACGTAKPGGMSGPTMSGRINQADPQAGLESTDILARNPTTERAAVKHILIGWGSLTANYPDGIDPRAAKRSESAAEELATSLRNRARDGEAFEALMMEFSEDQGTAKGASHIEVTSDAELVAPFIKLSLRLLPGEIGVVKSSYGWHVIKRVG